MRDLKRNDLVLILRKNGSYNFDLILKALEITSDTACCIVIYRAFKHALGASGDVISVPVRSLKQLSTTDLALLELEIVNDTYSYVQYVYNSFLKSKLPGNFKDSQNCLVVLNSVVKRRFKLWKDIRNEF